MIEAQAHSNIALIKYWGKRDQTLHLPTNSSLSLTLDALYTRTQLEWRSDLSADHILLNGALAAERQAVKVQRFLNLVREQYGLNGFAWVNSTNNFPTGAGLASSASGFAALALAATAAAGLELSPEELSRLARRGSGSASRSIYGGFAQWNKGQHADGRDSYAVSVMDGGDFPLRLIVVVLESRPKALSSSDGMCHTANTSPLYSGWLNSVEADLRQLRRALAEHDFLSLGQIAEHNALKMHATALASQPAVLYWQPETLAVLQAIWRIRAEGLPCYATIDAGPNVKVLVQPAHTEALRAELRALPGVQDVIVCAPGPAAHLVSA